MNASRKTKIVLSGIAVGSVCFLLALAFNCTALLDTDSLSSGQIDVGTPSQWPEAGIKDSGIDLAAINDQQVEGVLPDIVTLTDLSLADQSAVDQFVVDQSVDQFVLDLTIDAPKKDQFVQMDKAVPIDNKIIDAPKPDAPKPDAQKIDAPKIDQTINIDLQPPHDSQILDGLPGDLFSPVEMTLPNPDGSVNAG